MISPDYSIPCKNASEFDPGIQLIILAAGKSERMGVHKALLPVTSQHTLIEFLIHSYQSIGFSNIYVVHNPELNPARFPSLGVHWVLNARPELGRMHSIRMGLGALDGSVGCFLHPVDQPFIDSAIVNSMISELKPDSYIVPVYQGHGGHPILIGANVRECILLNPEEEQLKSILRRYKRKIVKSLDQRILLNINTMQEYHAFLDMFIHK
jgi:molybdenum cofactor cytidylyltransferase